MIQKCTSLVSSEKTSSKSTSNSEGGFLGHCASGPLFLCPHDMSADAFESTNCTRNPFLLCEAANVCYRCTLTCFDAKFTNDSTEKRSGGWTHLNASASDGVIESHLVYKPIVLSTLRCPSRIGFPDVFAARQHARTLNH